MQQADYWKRTPDGTVICSLCPHQCRITESQLGRCGIRRQREGHLVAEAYGLISVLALDPMEKKPLYHFHPGTRILSMGSVGCNFRCSFCQNWTISQQQPPLTTCTPEALVAEALQQQAIGVAYTYNEPLINIEYVLDCSRQVRKAGLVNVVVTNGYINAEPLSALLPLIDAWNIDLKAIQPAFYRDFCDARLAPVLATIQTVAATSAHLELTHLVVTEGNDQEAAVAELVEWIAGLSPEIPLHLSRYFPQYRWHAPATDPLFLEQTLTRARKKLTWVYGGNTTSGNNKTYCPECHTLLVSRAGYHVDAVYVVKNVCPVCGRQVPGVF